MKTDERIELQGVVTDCLPGTKFKVELENGHTLSGKLRTNYIRILKGDAVTVDLSISDPGLKNGRIIWRNK